jgi:hypothetical protein
MVRDRAGGDRVNETSSYLLENQHTTCNIYADAYEVVSAVRPPLDRKSMALRLARDSIRTSYPTSTSSPVGLAQGSN